MSTDHPTLFPPDQVPQTKFSSSWLVAVTAASIGVTVFLASSALQGRMFSKRNKRPRLILLGNAVSGLLAGLLALKVINTEIEEREEIRSRLDMVAEMNHHIRNALQVIELSAHSTKNEKAIASISDAVNRIERVLREMLGIERRKTARDGHETQIRRAS